MTNIVNPRIEVRVFGQEVFAIKDLYMDFDIVKDLDEEPNEASISIYNLNSDFRGKLTGSTEVSTPIEIYLTPSGIDTLVLAFRGDIDTARHINLRPGHETQLVCSSQALSHRTAYVSQKTFPKGTPVYDIVNFLADKIGLPSKVELEGLGSGIYSHGILLSQSFSGPAFPLLKRYAFDLGLYAFILDGVLNVTSIHEPQSPTVVTIKESVFLSTPQPTLRRDEDMVEMRTVFEGAHINPFAKKRKKNKKAKKLDVHNDYVEYNVVDSAVEGVDLGLLCQPDLQPDSIINLDIDGYRRKLYRVTEVNHHGNNETFDQWTTDIKADLYDDTAGDLLANL